MAYRPQITPRITLGLYLLNELARDRLNEMEDGRERAAAQAASNWIDRLAHWDTDRRIIAAEVERARDAR